MVTCNNVNLIRDLLRISYYKIYVTEPFLKKFDTDFKNLNISHIGEKNYSAKDQTFTITKATGEEIKLPNIS